MMSADIKLNFQFTSIYLHVEVIFALRWLQWKRKTQYLLVQFAVLTNNNFILWLI